MGRSLITFLFFLASFHFSPSRLLLHPTVKFKSEAFHILRIVTIIKPVSVLSEFLSHDFALAAGRHLNFLRYYTTNFANMSHNPVYGNLVSKFFHEIVERPINWLFFPAIVHCHPVQKLA